MDFSLNEEQRAWQLKAREFAKSEIRPISIQRDQIEGGFGPWDWDIIEKGSINFFFKLDQVIKLCVIRDVIQACTQTSTSDRSSMHMRALSEFRCHLIFCKLIPYFQ